MTEPKRSPSVPSVTPTSLSTQAARVLATTTKTRPQMQDISSRWLQRLLPWVKVGGGVYRVNRRLSHAVPEGAVAFTQVGAEYRVIPQTLCELPLLHDFDDHAVLEALADGFVQSEVAAGAVLVQAGQEAEHLFLIARGKVQRTQAGRYGDPVILGTLADGAHFGLESLRPGPSGACAFTVRALTPCIVLSLPRTSFTRALADAPTLRAHLQRLRERPRQPQDDHGQAAIELAAGHHGEASLPRTFVAYEPHPREIELAVVQTILRVHTRVADLYNDPFDQIQEQLRLTIESLREREEHELINNPDFGLLHNVAYKQRLQTRSGPPTPDDLDELITRRRKTHFLLAQPSAIAAFGRECTRRGLYPETKLVEGQPMQAWRGIPLLPCTEIPITDVRTTTIIALRTGEENQGVVGLRPANLPEEVAPGLNVRRMGIDERAVLRYLVSAYHSVAVLVPDALGVLENVELGR